MFWNKWKQQLSYSKVAWQARQGLCFGYTRSCALTRYPWNPNLHLLVCWSSAAQPPVRFASQVQTLVRKVEPGAAFLLLTVTPTCLTVQQPQTQPEASVRCCFLSSRLCTSLFVPVSKQASRSINPFTAMLAFPLSSCFLDSSDHTYYFTRGGISSD